MKHLYVLTICVLLLAACAPTEVTILPVDTAVALTMAALPRVETPTPPPAQFSDTPPATWTPTPQATAGSDARNAGSSGQGEMNPATPVSAACVPADGERERGLVTRVLSGDTVEVAIGNDTYKVKYIGISAPQLTPRIERFAPQSAAENKRLVNGQTIILVKGSVDRDAGGRLLRYVFVGDLFVNYELVRNGFASVENNPPDESCKSVLVKAENDAQISVIGFWAPTPVPTPTPRPTRPPQGSFIDIRPSVTAKAPCNCKDPDLRCKMFRTRSAAQACYDYCRSIGISVPGLPRYKAHQVCQQLP